MNHVTMPTKRSTARSSTTDTPDPDGRQHMVQTRIRSDAYERLVELANKDTRSMANYLARVIYEHLGIVQGE